MQFNNAIWLWGVGGLVIPLAIHLLSRKEGKVIRIGSIRHFEETSTRQFKSIKLNEILLLILRSLIILFIILFLAGLLWPRSATNNTRWLLIEKGLEHDSELKSLRDSLEQQGFETRAFTKGFPIVGDSISIAPSNYGALVNDLKEISLQEVVVFSASRAEAFRGKWTPQPDNMKWVTKALRPREINVMKVNTGKDSVWIRSGKFTTSATEFETVYAARGATDNDVSPLLINLIIDKKYGYDGKLIRAALSAIDAYVPYKILIEQHSSETLPANSTADWTIWLSDKPFTSKDSSIVLRPKQAEHLLEQANPSTWLLTERLQPENVLEENLTVSLAKLFFPETKLQRAVNQHDIRVADEGRLSERAETNTPGAPSSTTDSVLALLITITLITERFISFKRLQ
jgi:hypothetical protein